MNGQSRERRTFIRFRSHVPVEFKGNGISGKGFILDLSLGGCQIKSPTLLFEGYLLALTLLFPHEENPVMVGLATVRWAMNDKAGLEFSFIDRVEKARLAKVLFTY